MTDPKLDEPLDPASPPVPYDADAAPLSGTVADPVPAE